MTLLASISLLVACNKENNEVPPGEAPTSDNQVSSDNNYNDISADINSGSSSDEGGNNNQQVELGELDLIIADFVSDLDVIVPSVKEYNLEYDIYYYYAYQEYIIAAYCADEDNIIAPIYNEEFTSDTNLHDANTDYDYDSEDTTEDAVTYVYADTNQNVIVNFFNKDGGFYLYVYRPDGLFGTLDVSDIDTSWYVDYVNGSGFEVEESFSSDLVKDFLDITADINIPAIDIDAFVYCFVPSYEDDETGYIYPHTFYVVLQGDQLVDYGAILEEAGFTVDIQEHTESMIDWDLMELVDYTYYTVSAYDANKIVYINMEVDENGNTFITFNKFDDVFVQAKTTNTDWTDEEKALMNATLHQTLPFMAFGSDYQVFDASDDTWTLFVIMDSYYEDLSEDYINILLGLGYVKDDTSYDDTYYCYDNGYVYIEIYVGYEGGNYLEVYYEPTHLEPLNSLSLNTSSLDIVAGATYQLTPVYDPITATYPITWTSSNADVATVNETGLVSIKENATANSEVTITATALGGKTATCKFTVKANEVTGIAFTQDEYTVIPGAAAYVPDYVLLPYGVTTNETVTYSYSPVNFGINYNDNGELSADENAVVGTESTIKITLGSFEATATVRVLSGEVATTLTGTFFGIKKGESSYNTYKKTTEDGASYEAQAAAGNNADGGNGLQLRSKNSNSGVIGSCENRTCKSITFTFDANTQAGRQIDIYASNSPFAITDMYKSGATKVATISYDASNLTQTYTFTDDYAYIGFRSKDNALYLKSVEVVWH